MEEASTSTSKRTFTNGDEHDNPAKKQNIKGLDSANYVKLIAATSEDKGCRATMEDVCIIELDAKWGKGQGSLARLSFFGVFDGHGGNQCAKFAANNLHNEILDAGLLKATTFQHSGESCSMLINAKLAKDAVIEV